MRGRVPHPSIQPPRPWPSLQVGHPDAGRGASSAASPPRLCERRDGRRGPAEVAALRPDRLLRGAGRAGGRHPVLLLPHRPRLLHADQVGGQRTSTPRATGRAASPPWSTCRPRTWSRRRAPSPVSARPGKRTVRSRLQRHLPARAAALLRRGHEAAAPRHQRRPGGGQSAPGAASAPHLGLRPGPAGPGARPARLLLAAQVSGQVARGPSSSLSSGSVHLRPHAARDTRLPSYEEVTSDNGGL